MRQNRVHLMPPMSNFYARICVKATPSSNTSLVMYAGTRLLSFGNGCYAVPFSALWAQN